jgi:hypothetical protein
MKCFLCFIVHNKSCLKLNIYFSIFVLKWNVFCVLITQQKLTVKGDNIYIPIFEM